MHFLPIHLSSYIQERMGFSGGEYPVSEDTFARVLSLPLYAAMSDTDVDRVIGAVTTSINSYVG